MLTTVRGTHKNGQIIWKEEPPVQEPTEVIVTFLSNEDADTSTTEKKQHRGGSMRGEVWIADDFNAPLHDLTDYM